MALPVIRLNVVDAHRIVAVSDPKQATFTLYTFLKAVASTSDCEASYNDFCKQLKASNSGDSVLSRAGQAALSKDLFRTPSSARLIQSAAAVAADVFSQPAPTGLHPMSFTNSPSGWGADDEEAAQRRQRIVRSFFKGQSPTAPVHKELEVSSPMYAPSPLAETRRPGIGGEMRSPQRPLVFDDVTTEKVTSPFAHHGAENGTDVRPLPDLHGRRDNFQRDGLTLHQDSRSDEAAILNSIGHGHHASASSAGPSHSPQQAISTHMARTLKDIHEMIARDTLASQDLADRNAKELRTNNVIDLLTRIASVRDKVVDGEEEEASDPTLVANICDALTARLRNLQIFQLLQQHEEETLKIADLALRAECEAMKRQLRDAISALVRSEGRLTGEDSSLPPSDGRYVAEHFLFEQIQDTLQEASAMV